MSHGTLDHAFLLIVPVLRYFSVLLRCFCEIKRGFLTILSHYPNRVYWHHNMALITLQCTRHCKAVTTFFEGTGTRTMYNNCDFLSLLSTRSHFSYIWCCNMLPPIFWCHPTFYHTFMVLAFFIIVYNLQQSHVWPSSAWKYLIVGCTDELTKDKYFRAPPLNESITLVYPILG